MQNQRRSKMIVSFEAASLNQGFAQDFATQIDGIRLVWTPGSTQIFSDYLKSVRGQNGQYPVPMMIDISSYIRGLVVGLETAKEVEFGESLKLGEPNSNSDIMIEVRDWKEFFVADTTIYFGHGSVAMKVLSVGEKYVQAEVIQAGTLYPDMLVHGVPLKSYTSYKELPKEVLDLAKESACEYLVIPGFEDAEEIQRLREYLSAEGRQAPWLIQKVDSDRVYSRLESILPYVDGVVISRLEMALTIQPSMIPMLTKEIIQSCNNAAKVVLTASEMLGSMRFNATPTRAEVSDIANAISDGTDAVVLSEEVSLGPYLGRATALMAKIIKDFEDTDVQSLNWQKHEPAIENEMDAVAYTSYQAAELTGAKALVCITVSGNTALKLSSFRVPIPIIAVTFSEETKNRLRLIRGVSTVMLDTEPNIDQVLPLVNDRLLRDSWLKVGDTIIFISITLSSVGRENSNLFTIQKLH